MIPEHDFHYAMENTRVVVRPQSAIETFGTTRFHFSLVSELLDEIETVRIRSGTIEAERPRILAPTHFSKVLLEGFGEEARDFADWIEANPQILDVSEREGADYKVEGLVWMWLC